MRKHLAIEAVVPPVPTVVLSPSGRQGAGRHPRLVTGRTVVPEVSRGGDRRREFSADAGYGDRSGGQSSCWNGVVQTWLPSPSTVGPVSGGAH